MSRRAFEKGVGAIIESSRRTGHPVSEAAARKMMREGAAHAERVAREKGTGGKLAGYRDGERE